MRRDGELLERGRELGALVGLLDGLVTSGTGGVVLIEGVAGIGKSSLLRELVAKARAQPEVRVLTARGTELELELAFGAVRHLFAPVVSFPEEERERTLAGPAALAGAVLGIGETSRSDLADPLYALSWLASNLSERCPLLLAVDDVHWLDVESGRFLAYLANRLEGLPILLVGSARPHEPGTTAGALHVLRDLATIVSPEPLGRESVATILGDGAIAEEACRVTGGNPFLLAELARALERAEPGTAIEELQTRAVASSVSRRVRRISPAAAALADAVALFPAGAELSLAAEVAGVPESEAAEAADALITADVLAVRAGAVEFLHPLMRSAIYEDVGAFARRRGHAAAAAALKARGERPEEVAAHLLAGDPGGSREDFLILRAAAEEAIAAVAPRAAVRYLTRALEEEAAEPEEERSLLLELGRWQRRIGDPGSLETLARALELGVGTREHVPAAIELAATAFSQADHQAVACTVAAVDGVDATADERLILDMLLAESLWADMQIEASVRLIDRVPRDLSGETPAQRVALGMAGAVHLIKCAPAAEVMGMLRRSVGDDGAAPTPLAGIDLGDPLQWMVVLGELDEAQAIAEERMEHARVRGDEALFAATQNAYGWMLTLRGDLKGGEAAYRLGLASPAVSPFMRAHIRANLLQTLIQYGRLDEAEQELAILAGAGVAQIAHIARLRRAQIALGRGEFEAAVDPLEQAMQAQMRVVPDPHPNDVWVAADLVDALLGAGRPADALSVIEPLVTLSERVGATFGLGLHGSALARITGDPADHERAVNVLADSPYRWDEARARLEYGSALRRAGRRVQAREQLTRALAYFHRQGVHHLAGRAREELAVSGARLRAVEELSGAAALTPAESRIARLAADGMSNKQIAQHLFVTVGTVQTTLVHCYRKLGVSGRRELPDALGDIAA